MIADALLSRLGGVKRSGVDRWLALCPAHEDRHASLSVRELDDGRLLVHCFAGCNAEDVLTAAGLTFSALFPAGALAPCLHPERRPFPALDVLRCVAFEALVVAVAAGNLAKGLVLCEADRARLLLAAGRLQAAVEACRA
jgi:hypothetical protein